MQELECIYKATVGSKCHGLNFHIGTGVMIKMGEATLYCGSLQSAASSMLAALMGVTKRSRILQPVVLHIMRIYPFLLGVILKE